MINPNATRPSVSSNSRWYSITSPCLRARSRSSRACTTSGGVGRSDRRRETHAVGRGVRTLSRSGATGDLPREAGELVATMLIVTELVEAGTGR